MKSLRVERDGREWVAFVERSRDAALVEIFEVIDGGRALGPMLERYETSPRGAAASARRALAAVADREANR